MLGYTLYRFSDKLSKLPHEMCKLAGLKRTVYAFAVERISFDIPFGLSIYCAKFPLTQLAGSTQATRFAAARQIGEIAKSHPQELNVLLKKVYQQFHHLLVLWILLPENVCLI